MDFVIISDRLLPGSSDSLMAPFILQMHANGRKLKHISSISILPHKSEESLFQHSGHQSWKSSGQQIFTLQTGLNRSEVSHPVTQVQE